jgi:hypothetical protein
MDCFQIATMGVKPQVLPALRASWLPTLAAIRGFENTALKSPDVECSRINRVNHQAANPEIRKA